MDLDAILGFEFLLALFEEVGSSRRNGQVATMLGMHLGEHLANAG